MRNFSIKELEQLSGIKAHTIRTWEVRYSIFSPQRTVTNIRYYSIGDLKNLLNIAQLVRHGYRISQLAKMDAAMLSLEAGSLTLDVERKERVVNMLLVHMFGEDIDLFEAVLDECRSSWRIDETIHHIIMPFLDRANILSYKSSDTNVHFAVTAVRKKIIYGIESLRAGYGDTKKALLFLPEGEHYDLVLLYLNYLLKSRGIQVLYLGTNISTRNLVKVVNEKKPDLVYTYFTARNLDGSAHKALLEEPQLRDRLFVVHAKEDHYVVASRTNVVFLNYKSLRSSNVSAPA